VVGTVLRSLGYHITMAETRAAAFYVLHRSEFDLILSDVVLPDGTNDHRFVEEAQAIQPAVKVVFMSGYPAHTEEGNLLQGGTTVLLTKPFSKEKLGETIAEALKESRPGNEAIRRTG
jgi:DNA-binding NtrC family response regulator